jgi:SOS-response transcriptional repressor LexA
MNGKRLKELRKSLNMSQIELGDVLGINASAISQMETNRINPSLDTLLLFHKHFKANLHWLLTGKGQMFEEAISTNVYQHNHRIQTLKNLLTEELLQITQAKQDYSQSDIIDIPVKGEIAAGLPLETTEDELDVITVRRSMIKGSPDDFICLRVNGRSMEPDIKNNDLILIRQNTQWDKMEGKICAVRVDGSITLKQLVIDRDNQVIILVALNNDFKPIIIHPEEHQDIVLIGYLYFLFRKMNPAA